MQEADSIHSKIVNHFNYLSTQFNWVRQQTFQTIKHVYNTVWSTVSLDQLNRQTIQDALLPVIYSGAGFLAVEIATKDSDNTENEVNEILYKFILGFAILTLSAAHRISEKKIESPALASLAAATEIVGIVYLYISTFYGSRMLLNDYLPDEASLITSTGISALAVPNAMSKLAQYFQDNAIKRLHDKGAQLSHEAVLASGLTSWGYYYFLMNHFLGKELLTQYRLLQLGLISENMTELNAIRKVRNWPSFFGDLLPSLLKRVLAEKEKSIKDYQRNTTKHKVLLFSDKGTSFVYKKRKDLRSGDLVVFEEKDLKSSPVSGEVVAYECDDKGNIVNQLTSQKIRANYQANNGEANWRSFNTKTEMSEEVNEISLRLIQTRKLAGVLKGTQLDFNGANNTFIRIKKTGFTVESGFEKKAVINKIIAKYKDQNALLALLFSAFLAVIVKRDDFYSIPSYTLKLFFNLAQMIMPFAEGLLRGAINKKAMEKLNETLTNTPMQTIDALQAGDLVRVLKGHYLQEFPEGPILLSDKTGTLTTPEMKVLGLWTKEMDADAASLIENQTASYLLPDREKLQACFKVFAYAYQYNKKEIEQEEFAILEFFKKILNDENCLSVEKKENHLVKTFGADNRSIKTFHLGLYREWSGCLTLVKDAKKKYLIFCGIPKENIFHDTPLLKIYSRMKVRRGVLTRDWCVAGTIISKQLFSELKNNFINENTKAIERILLSRPDVLRRFEHYEPFKIKMRADIS